MPFIASIGANVSVASLHASGKLRYWRLFCRATCSGALLFWLVSAVAFGQSSTSIRGTVTDSSGGAIPGAEVVLSEVESKTQRTVQTASGGEYQFVLIPPGTYSLRVTAQGFSPFEQPRIQLLINTPATLNVQLKLGAITESVTVGAEAVAINTVDASIGNTFSENQVKQIPLEGRNVPDLLTVQAGVAYTGNRPDIDKSVDTRSGSVNGARSDQSNITLDGVDVNDQGTGAAFTSVLPVTLDSVQEFRVTTTNYNADQGNGSGAQVALVTKSGTNAFHGSLYEYLRNTDTSANDYFLKQAQLESGLPNKPDKLNRNIFGVSLGGPIKKNRLFFFVNFEGTREVEGQTVVRSVPTATLRDGIIQYPNVNGGITQLTPQQITSLDPLHLGPSPVMLNYFKSYPLPNDFAGVGDGLNFAGYRFSAPVTYNNNVYIARLDYHLDENGKETMFWRGALQNLYNPQAPLFPGAAPELTLTDYSKGSVVGLTSVLTNTLVNTVHWGFTRESQGYQGDSNQPWNTFSGLDQGITYSHSFQMPMNSFLDDLSWTKGKHTFQFGGNIGFIRDPRQGFQKSFSTSNDGLGNANPTGFANQSSPLNPVNGGFPGVNPLYNNSYDLPMAALLGMQVSVSAVYNFNKEGTLLPQGTEIDRDFGLNYYEFYGQDSWRIKPNLTLTYGLRYSLMPAPWEVNGEQVAPNVGFGTLFNENVANMAKGIGYEADPTISFILGGKANGGPPLYQTQKDNLSPRVAVAYSPRPENEWLKKLVGDGDKTVIRSGFGRVYDRPGMQIINSFDSQGSFGLTTTLTNACCLDGAAQLPRITSLNVIPTVDQVGNTVYEPAPPGGFPNTPPAGNNGGEAEAWGVDNTLKTPYAYTTDVSITRVLPKQMSLMVAYVGRFGRDLLTQRDLMPQLDITDPATGIDYYSAASRLTQLINAGVPTSAITNSLVGSTASYWQDMVQPLKPGGAYTLGCSGGSTRSVVKAVYDLYDCEPAVAVLGEALINYYGSLTDAKIPGQTYYFRTGPFSYQNAQFANMFAWSSVGRSDYNGLQVTLRKQFGYGVQFDLNYTWSKSLDTGSAATSVSAPCGSGSGCGTVVNGLLGDALVNSFQLNQIRAVSDFDTTHQINADWVAELPFGKGKAFLGSPNRVLDAFIGGWQLTGLARWTSGFPVSVSNGESWPTDWWNSGVAQELAKPQTCTCFEPGGAVNLFSNPTAALLDFTHYLPGESGTRNPLRGQGFASLDMGLTKRWRLPLEGHSLQFRWEVFNVPNLVRFNVQASPPSLLETADFGVYTGLLTQPRVMQFGLRYEF
jgi:hypothetical protein